jgi:drug/metabolite transporter (DMT)-like permease
MLSSRSLPFAAALAALINAAVWGVSWYPLKWLNANGVGALWATCIVFAACTAFVIIGRPKSLPALIATPALFWLSVASGMTNACFNVSLATGDVVRVVLLFYVMPVWAALLARWLLKEPLTPSVLARALLALLGASLVLGEGELVFPIPKDLADWLALAGGFFFALNNVLLRKHSEKLDEARALAMFSGGFLVAPFAALAMISFGYPMAFAPTSSAWIGLALFAIMVLIGNFALQYGAERLRANVLSLLMLAEILIATLSSWIAGNTQLTDATLLGGALIVSASLFAIFSRPPRHDPQPRA